MAPRFIGSFPIMKIKLVTIRLKLLASMRIRGALLGFTISHL